MRSTIEAVCCHSTVRVVLSSIEFKNAELVYAQNAISALMTIREIADKLIVDRDVQENGWGHLCENLDYDVSI